MLLGRRLLVAGEFSDVDVIRTTAATRVLVGHTPTADESVRDQVCASLLACLSPNECLTGSQSPLLAHLIQNLVGI